MLHHTHTITFFIQFFDQFLYTVLISILTWKQALGILCETVKDRGTVKNKRNLNKGLDKTAISSWLRLDGGSLKSFNDMCLKIVELIDCSKDESDTPIKLAAVSALEVLANKFPSDNPIYISCLTSVVKHMDSSNIAVSCGCLRTTGALITVLGPRALSELPHIIKHMIQRAWGASTNARFSGPKDSLLFSVLVTLESVVDKLGGFLSPYLEDILELMVLHPEYISESDLKMKVKADAVRRFVIEKIPVRLTLKPLLCSYPKALKSGDSNLSITFGMVASLIGTMDRSSIVSSHEKIFEQCLVALDLRRKHPESVNNIDIVEQSVIDAMIVLTMKLTETMFKPLFIRSLEWAESDLKGNGNLNRSISFYRFINKLTERHRSLFVPYFKYLVEGSTRFLTNFQETESVGLTQKKKKAKIEGSISKEGVLSPEQWHLRALIISAFHKCFVYDTGNLKFLDPSNFKASSLSHNFIVLPYVLLEPLVSQLVAEAPACILELTDIPSVKEVDESLVACLGHMAVAAGSDLLWKPLNHDVLMQTRSEKVRARILGLRVVKYFLEHLKNEYLMLLPETIPFLAELLEDVELPVKSLAQEILKEMENLSGENLKEYL
ncbi:hypothetical protein GIB67_008615 [Kingdonia uniflora]|uniref:BP28 C-terminal domain-containing protein n=1 Tax=Kingdonia uniflora TaxID=39325 RepID=A0A7J7M549_9MAGN|nr:hypothetical protein GIB67_008615 [Kingdonia uniflora]